MEKFKDNTFKTLEGTAFHFVMILSMSFLIFFDGLENAYWPMIGFVFIMMYGMFSFSFNYFEMTDNQIIIKNSFWLFWSKTYKFIDIESISIGSKRRSMFRVITVVDKNKKERNYSSSCLTAKTYNELSKLLKKRKIDVYYFDDTFKYGKKI